MGPITWKSVFRSIGEVWGLHNRSLLYSLVQLFLRPGYFISDYISGKRQVSFPPVKMLALIALLGVLVDYLKGTPIAGVFNNDFDFAGDKMLFIDNAFEWMNLHPEVMSLILLSYLIIPNYFIYRYAPRNPHHTLPQGFFIQVLRPSLFWSSTCLMISHPGIGSRSYWEISGRMPFTSSSLDTACGEHCGAWFWHWLAPTCWR